MKHLILASALVLPFATSAAFAAGGGEEKAPSKPKCETGLIYDKKSKTCVTKDSKLDVDSLYENVRELAYAGRYGDAQVVLSNMPADDDRTLTYLGFTNRKMGNTDAAMAYYNRALEVNPANILARSYMGQGFVEQGRLTEAVAQLRAIADHGGQGTWAEASLRTAILDGKTSNY